MTEIKTFFENYILPLHQKIKTGEVKYLNDDYRTDADSYFTQPQHAQYHYLNTIASEDEASLTAYLQDFWKNDPALQPMIPDLVKLALALKEENREQTAELSPFLYVMF